MPDRFCIEYLAIRGDKPADYKWMVNVVSEAKDAEDAADKLRQNTPDLDLATAMRVTPLDDDLGGLYLTDLSPDDGPIMREVEEDEEGEYYLV